VRLIVEQGEEAVESLPKGIRGSQEAVAETIENNVRKIIIDEMAVNPKYYEKMSELLDALIELRKKAAMEYKAYLAKIVELTKKVAKPETHSAYPGDINSTPRRALYDNLGENEELAVQVDTATPHTRGHRTARKVDEMLDPQWQSLLKQFRTAYGRYSKAKFILEGAWHREQSIPTDPPWWRSATGLSRTNDWSETLLINCPRPTNPKSDADAGRWKPKKSARC